MKLNYIIAILFLVTACAGTNDQKFTSPQGYDLVHPETFVLPNILNEISGISFSKGNSSKAYAIQDEEGKLFYFKPGEQEIYHSKFSKKGDYEDVAVCNETVVVLRSDGVLFTFPLSEVGNKEITSAKEWNSLLPAAEYEGLYADESNNKLYALCKQSSTAKHDKTAIVYQFGLANDGNITNAGNIEVSVKDIEKITGQNKISFHPSALARQPATGNWFIVSSVNKMLVVTDGQWKVKNVYPLDAGVFNQPEGIAFDSGSNLYISNEGGKTGNGNILKFKFAKP